MTGKRLLLHSLFLFLLPVIVAWWGLSVASAVALVLVALLWRWAISLSAIMAPARVISDVFYDPPRKRLTPPADF